MGSSWSSDTRGAHGGNIDPEPILPGATHVTGEQLTMASRNHYRAAPGAGQAASAPAELHGVLTTDAPPSALDGHVGSAVSNHPDGPAVWRPEETKA